MTLWHAGVMRLLRESGLFTQVQFGRTTMVAESTGVGVVVAAAGNVGVGGEVGVRLPVGGMAARLPPFSEQARLNTTSREKIKSSCFFMDSSCRIKERRPDSSPVGAGWAPIVSLVRWWCLPLAPLTVTRGRGLLVGESYSKSLWLPPLG
jgi:hypothetical protein